MAIDNKILIYSEQTSPRLDYVLNLVCKAIWEIEWEWTDNLEYFEASQIGILNYSQNNLLQGIQILPSGLLFEKDISKQSIAIEIQNDLPSFFTGDYFSMIFYMISRYEEYLPFQADNHGRFSGSQSLAYKHDFLEKPMVHLWADVLKQKILSEFPFIKFGQRKFNIQPSYDIDIAWAFKNKGFKRQLGGIFKSLIGNSESISKRLKILLDSQKDPFDTFEYIDFINAKHLTVAKYFILIGDYGEFDKNTSHKNSDFINLLRKLNKKYEIGVHPSYQSNSDFKKLIVEKQRLEKIIKTSINRSRQHYLKLNFPDTYQRLIESGIKEDYSMGFHDRIGFRAGLAIPFYWYDLSKDIATELKIFPFQIMDVTLKQYLKLSTNEAIQKIEKIRKEIQDVGGELTYLWHNSSFYEKEGWAGWNLVLESFND